ncbi:MAG: hypothetical protein QW579_04310 [Desulfurococcaceae archaeon]
MSNVVNTFVGVVVGVIIALIVLGSTYVVINSLERTGLTVNPALKNAIDMIGGFIPLFVVLVLVAVIIATLMMFRPMLGV